MTLPAPDLDNRRFQDLVDDAKRLVQQRCPQWTDHNVSDPGVTLIETFAFMVDQLLYRLNRVPDRLYVAFLDLIGVTLYPPGAARADVTFWLSAPQARPVVVPAGAQVATERSETDEGVVFTVVKEARAVATHLEAVATRYVGRSPRDRTDDLAAIDGSFYCFHKSPEVGDELLVGLSDSAPSCVVLLRFDCTIEGHGVDPDNPPLVWEAWSGQGWDACEVERDETGGLNRAGDIVLHLPATHTASILTGRRAGWLRCRVVQAGPKQPHYSTSPRVTGLEAATIGVTALCVHAEPVTDEVLGLSEEVPGQAFALRHRPVVEGPQPLVVEVASGSGWERWTRVETFAMSHHDSHHFTLDPAAGVIRFGPAVREPDGRLRHYGAVPPKGVPLRVPLYWTGGGRRGNVAKEALRVLKSTVPYIERAENRHAARGGVDGEDLDSAKERGALHLRSRERAVTIEDYEEIARRAAPDAARIRCVPVAEDSGAVRVLIVPNAPAPGRRTLEDLQPGPDMLGRIADALAERRVIGARVLVEPPRYCGLTVVARLLCKTSGVREAVEAAAQQALYRHLDPLLGGQDGRGWPFGRGIGVGELYGVLQRVEGVEYVDLVRLFPADALTGERHDETARFELPEGALVFSVEHDVRAEPAGPERF